VYDFLVAYDVFDKKRLSKVKKIVYSYSLGGQKSALEVPLDRKMMRELIENLTKIIKNEDRVNIIKIIDKPILIGKAKHTPYEKNGIILL